MPLNPDSIYLIRSNLEVLQSGAKVRPVVIGKLTPAQLTQINAERLSHTKPMPEITDEILFIGKHIYDSRILRDGYSIDDVIDQIISAISESSVVVASPKMTALESATLRSDRYGNQIRDKAIFECTTKHPKPELYSVIPKGDKNKPPRP